MPAAAVAGVGLLVSAYSAHQASQAQSRAADLQRSAIQSDQAFRQQQYDDYKKNYGPLEQEMLQKANSEQPLNLGPNWARIQSNFDQAGRNNEVSLARKGMTGSGLDTHNNLEGQRAYALSDAFSKGIQNRDALRLQLLNAGKNMPQQAGFASQGNQNLSNFWGNQSNLFAGAAGQAGQGISSSLGALGYALGSYQGQAPTPTVDTQITSMPTDNLSPIAPTNTSNWASTSPIPQGGIIPTDISGWPSLTPSTVPGLGSSPITGPRDQ